MTANKVRIGVIGIGNMGAIHVRDVAALENCELAAICDVISERATVPAAEHGVPAYTDYRAMLAGTQLDAVIVATPHYDHTPISIDCLSRGIHVLVEKPIAVHINDARKMIAAYEQAKKKFPGLVFAIMFMQRTYGYWQKIKEMIAAGELGRLVRTTWIITDWFRTQNYYDSGGWRATWNGEGGGVLLNQCPHNLDLYQWMVGMPSRVTGFAAIGKYHNIEVEDEVTGFFEHANGMVGHFVTTTAESPGTNRLEIIGERGKLTFEDGKLTFFRNQDSMLSFIQTSPLSFDKVPGAPEEIPYQHHGQPGHAILIENFANAILQGEQNVRLIASAPEGLNSLTLANAIMFSSHLGRPLDLPIDSDAYEVRLQELIRGSRFQKTVREMKVEDLGKSYT
jgi:predicted dehydrogenase